MNQAETVAVVHNMFLTNEKESVKLCLRLKFYPIFKILDERNRRCLVMIMIQTFVILN